MAPVTVDCVAPAAGDHFGPGVECVEYTSGMDGAADWALVWPPDESPGAARAVRSDRWIVMIHGHGSADATIPVDQSRRLADRLADRPTFRYVELADAGHDAPLPWCVEALEWVLTRAE